MKRFLGVDGGGSKTAFALIDHEGRVLGAHREGPAYYLETGLDGLREMLARGVHATLTQAGGAAPDFAFLGLPAYGEDSSLQEVLDGIAAGPLPKGRYRCGNDAVCGWAGGLAAGDGIHLIAGTGSMAYGEWAGRSARAGGWGELFSDEGSAHWIAVAGLNVFSRMSDGRLSRGPLHAVFRRHFQLQRELDLCAAIYGRDGARRSDLAALAPLVAEAAEAGDAQAAQLFTRAAEELAQMVQAVRQQLAVPDDAGVSVSYSGGMFRFASFVDTLRATLTARGYALQAPRLLPVFGAALYAAKLAGAPLASEAIRRLEAHSRATAG
ncbi:MAG: N-acetylglucosamine kinase [Proteobacteria bacterium]|nr:N-acetylglucosamine kinase [Pseudomonadota bacterium]